MSTFKSKDRKSLCEESMLVFVNILKFSSLSIARRTLVTSDDDDDNNDNDNDNNSDDNKQAPVVPRKKGTYTNTKKHKALHHRRTPQYVPKPESQKITKRSQKLEQPQESNKSYVMLPENHHDEITTVDGKFAEYIRRFHKKAENDLHTTTVESKAANYIKRFHEKNMKDLNNESMRKSHYVLPPPPHQVFK